MPPTTPVLIEALCRRPAGLNLIDMGDGTIYDFRDDGTGAQVALVSNPGHQRKLLSITEGFAFKGAAAEPALVLDPAGFLGTALPPSHPYPGDDPGQTSYVAASTAPPEALPPASAARVLLEHIVFYNMVGRHTEEFVDDFIKELSMIADGRVRHGALVDAEAAAANAERESAVVGLQLADIPAPPKEPAGDLSISDHPDLNGKTLAEIRVIYAEEHGKAASPRHGIDVLVAKIETIRAERAKGPAN